MKSPPYSKLAAETQGLKAGFFVRRGKKAPLRCRALVRWKKVEAAAACRETRLIAESIASLNSQWGGTLVRFEQRYGGPVAILDAAGGTAVVALQGAQLLSFVPKGGREVLWLSPLAKLGTGKAVRGGIPICWPWFGPAPDDAKKPAHGFVRAAPWRVLDCGNDRDPAFIRLGFDAGGIDPALWPHRAEVQIEIAVGESFLRVALETTNSGPTAFRLTQALHSYLAVGDIAEVMIEGLDGRRYIDQLAPATRSVQSGPIRIGGEVDRIYQQSPDTVTVIDSANARRITVAKSGSRSTVVWNPWVEKSGRLGDMGEDGYRHMVCIETANAGEDVVTLAPGARHRLVTTISEWPE